MICHLISPLSFRASCPPARFGVAIPLLYPSPLILHTQAWPPARHCGHQHHPQPPCCQIPWTLRRRPYSVSRSIRFCGPQPPKNCVCHFVPTSLGTGPPPLSHPSCTHSPGFARRHPPGFLFCSVAPWSPIGSDVLLAVGKKRQSGFQPV